MGSAGGKDPFKASMVMLAGASRMGSSSRYAIRSIRSMQAMPMGVQDASTMMSSRWFQTSRSAPVWSSPSKSPSSLILMYVSRSGSQPPYRVLSFTSSPVRFHPAVRRLTWPDGHIL